MEQYIVNGKVFLDGSFQEKTIGVEGGCIRILPKDADLEDGVKVYDAEGKKVVPGFLQDWLWTSSDLFHHMYNIPCYPHCQTLQSHGSAHHIDTS